MKNMKFNDISKSVDLFFSDDFEKECSIPTDNKDTLPLGNTHDDIFDDVIHGNQIHPQEENKPIPRQMNGKNYQEQLKIVEELGLNSNNELESNPFQLSLDQQSSSKFQQVSEYFNTKGKAKEEPKKKESKKNKTKMIKRENDEITQNGQTRNQQKQGDRKVRTTVSEEKIKILQHLFPFIEKRIPYKDTLINLKDVAKIVNLGYSTILHKYKDYRRKGAVQKGLLLKSKDVKRKYHKSLIIEKHIKDALRERKFRTAKQLAQYISQKNNIKVNRSIISRHLNEMHRQRECQDIADWVERDQNQDQDSPGENMISLRDFSRIFFGLKNENFKFFYITVIRLNLIEGRLANKVPEEATSMKIVNLVVTATENHLLSYTPIPFAEDQQTSKRRFLNKTNDSAYRALYDDLMLRIEQGREQIESSYDPVYVIFPYDDKQKDFVYRQKVMRKLISEKINVLVVPPKLNPHKINFIQNWFFRHIFQILQQQSYLDLSEFSDVLMKAMNEEQGTLFEFALDMIHAIRKVQ